MKRYGSKVILNVIGGLDCFQWLKEQDAVSLWDEPELNLLYDLHKSYGIIIQLFNNQEEDGFQSSNLPIKYCRELETVRHWFHVGKYSSIGSDAGNFSGEDIFSIPEVDLDLDSFSNGMTVACAVEVCGERINSNANKERLYFTVSESMLLQVRQPVVRLLEQLEGVKKRLYFAASAAYGDFVYFTTFNTRSLFRMDIHTERIEWETDFPVELTGTALFSAIIPYKGRLWLLPWDAPELFVYEIAQKRLKCCKYESEHLIYPYDRNYIEPVVDGHFLWLHPTEQPIFVRIDMESGEAVVFDRFPEDVYYVKPPEVSTESMTVCGEYVYLFRDKCSHHLRINKYTGDIECCEFPFEARYFGTYLEDGWFLFAPADNGCPLIFYNITTSQKDEVELPDWIWNRESPYALGYIYRIGGYAYICPLVANAGVCVNLENRNVSFIKWPESQMYDTLLEYSTFSSLITLHVNDEIWFISCEGNHILRTDLSGNTCGVIRAEIPWDELHVQTDKKFFAIESDEYDLNRFLGNLKVIFWHLPQKPNTNQELQLKISYEGDEDELSDKV